MMHRPFLHTMNKIRILLTGHDLCSFIDDRDRIGKTVDCMHGIKLVTVQAPCYRNSELLFLPRFNYAKRGQLRLLGVTRFAEWGNHYKALINILIPFILHGATYKELAISTRPHMK